VVHPRRGRTFVPHPAPHTVKTPPGAESGIRAFDLLQIPERSCQWKYPDGSLAGPSDRSWHPFLVVRFRRGLVVGLGCTKTHYTRWPPQVALPTYDAARIRWDPEFQRSGYAVIDPWDLTFGQLLFEGEVKPRRIGALLDRSLQEEISRRLAAAETPGVTP